MTTSSDRLRSAIQQRKADAATLDLSPKTAHEAMTRAMVEDLGRELERQRGDVAGDIEQVRGRVDTLIWVIVGAVVLDVLGRVIGI